MLVLMVGAAVNTGDVSGQRNRADSVAISVAGGLRTGVAYVLDGAMHNDPTTTRTCRSRFPDALQEFSVATGGLSAQNGMHSGASVNAVTKSGTNSIHGNPFEFLRDHRFNATDAFAPRGEDGKKVADGLVRNQFGGTLGGPVVRDKLFFFGAYQGTITTQTPASTWGSCRPRRCWRATSRRSRHPRATRPADRAARAVREQPDQSRALQSAAVKSADLPADDRPMRRDQLQRPAR